MRLIIGSLFMAFAAQASAQTLPADMPLTLVAIEPEQVIFLDNRPGRSTSSAEEASIFTIHVTRTPVTPDGKVAAVLRAWTFSCLTPDVRQTMQAPLSEDGTLLQSITREVKGKTKPGMVLEDMSILACDHVNPRGHTETFTGLKPALAFARKTFSGQ